MIFDKMIPVSAFYGSWAYALKNPKITWNVEKKSRFETHALSHKTVEFSSRPFLVSVRSDSRTNKKSFTRGRPRQREGRQSRSGEKKPAGKLIFSAFHLLHPVLIYHIGWIFGSKNNLQDPHDEPCVTFSFPVILVRSTYRMEGLRVEGSIRRGGSTSSPSLKLERKKWKRKRREAELFAQRVEWRGCKGGGGRGGGGGGKGTE